MPRKFKGQYSFTRLKTWEWCHLFFKLSYIDKIPQPETPPLITGSLAHEALDAYGKHCVSKGVSTDFDHWGGVIVPGILLRAPAEVKEDLREILDTARDSITFEGCTPDDTFLEVDLAFNEAWERVDWFAKEAFFRARIDRLRVGKDSIRITDWKTNRRIEPASELPSDLQFRIYGFTALGMNGAPAEPAISVERFYLRYGVSQSADLDLEDVRKVQGEIEETAARIEQEKKFKARLGDHCRYCFYTDRCYEFRQAHAATDFRVRDEAHAVELAGRLQAVKASEKQLTAALKAWVEGAAPIPMGDGKLLGFTPVEKRFYEDAKGIVAALKKAGVDGDAIWGALNTTGTALKKLAKQIGRKPKDFMEEMEPLATVKAESHFRIYKPGTAGEED